MQLNRYCKFDTRTLRCNGYSRREREVGWPSSEAEHKDPSEEQCKENVGDQASSRRCIRNNIADTEKESYCIHKQSNEFINITFHIKPLYVLSSFMSEQLVKH